MLHKKLILPILDGVHDLIVSRDRKKNNVKNAKKASTIAGSMLGIATTYGIVDGSLEGLVVQGIFIAVSIALILYKERGQ